MILENDRSDVLVTLEEAVLAFLSWHFCLLERLAGLSNTKEETFWVVN